MKREAIVGVVRPAQIGIRYPVNSRRTSVLHLCGVPRKKASTGFSYPVHRYLLMPWFTPMLGLGCVPIGIPQPASFSQSQLRWSIPWWCELGPHGLECMSSGTAKCKPGLITSASPSGVGQFAMADNLSADGLTPVNAHSWPNIRVLSMKKEVFAGLNINPAHTKHRSCVKSRRSAIGSTASISSSIGTQRSKQGT